VAEALAIYPFVLSRWKKGNSSATKAQRHKEEILIIKPYQKKKNQ